MVMTGFATTPLAKYVYLVDRDSVLCATIDKEFTKYTYFLLAVGGSMGIDFAESPYLYDNIDAGDTAFRRLVASFEKDFSR